MHKCGKSRIVKVEYWKYQTSYNLPVQLGNQWKAWCTMHIVQKRRILSWNMEIKLFFISKYLLLWPFRFVAYFIITIVTEPDVKFTNSIEFYVVPIFDKESLKISIVVSLTSYLNTLNRFCYFLLEFHRSIQCLFTVIGFRECVQFHRNWSDIDIFCVLCDKLNLPLAYNANMYQKKRMK